MLVVALRIEREHAPLEQSRLPATCSPLVIPGLTSDDVGVESWNTEVRERINDVVIICKACAEGDTATWRERFGVVRPDDCILVHSSMLGNVRRAIRCTETVLIFVYLSAQMRGGRSQQRKSGDAGGTPRGSPAAGIGRECRPWCAFRGHLL